MKNPTLSDFEAVKLLNKLHEAKKQLSAVRWTLCYETLNPEPWRDLVLKAAAVAQEAKTVQEMLQDHCRVIGHPAGLPTHIKEDPQ